MISKTTLIATFFLDHRVLTDFWTLLTATEMGGKSYKCIACRAFFQHFGNKSTLCCASVIISAREQSDILATMF